MMDLLLKGGPVMIPLLFSSVLALAVSIERFIYLWRSRVDTEDLMDDIKLSLQQGKVLEAMQIAKKSRGPVAAILAAGIAHYDRPREKYDSIWKKWAPMSFTRWSDAWWSLTVSLPSRLCWGCWGQ